jgi:hypothetical protein
MRSGIHNTFSAACRAGQRLFGWKQFRSFAHTLPSTTAFVIIPVLVAAGLGGCPQKPVKPKFIQVGVTQPPHEPFPQDAPVVPPQIDSPALPYFEPQMSSALSNPPRPPAPRRVAVPTEPEPEPTKQEAPQISPQLSPEEKSHAQASTDADIKGAQQGLDTAAHHTLNPTQQDMVDKISGFLTQAREAIGVADWLRAKNLAQKAHVLSNELVRSF